MQNKDQTVVITGANRGIGLALAGEYKKRGAEVIGVCRNTNESLNAIADKVIEGVDVSESTGIDVFLSALGSKQVDILINNAGILTGETLGEIDYNQITRQLYINAIAPLRITEALLPNLKRGAKVGMITSRMGSISDNGSGGYYGYRMSKAALNAASVSLAHDIKALDIALAILHPGFVQTEMVNNNGDITADIAAARLAKRIDELTLDNTGSFWHSSGEMLPW